MEVDCGWTVPLQYDSHEDVDALGNRGACFLKISLRTVDLYETATRYQPIASRQGADRVKARLYSVCVKVPSRVFRNFSH